MVGISLESMKSPNNLLAKKLDGFFYNVMLTFAWKTLVRKFFRLTNIGILPLPKSQNDKLSSECSHVPFRLR